MPKDKSKEKKTIFEETEYKGNPMVNIVTKLEDGTRGFYPLSLGLKKVEMILENVDELKAFAEKHKK
jgi:hypothetical protein